MSLINDRDVLLSTTLPRLLPAAAASMVADLTSALWSGATLLTVTDGAFGSTARRSIVSTPAVLAYSSLIMIDRTRVYRTRFWARASSDANGTLSADLRQFTSSDPAGATGAIGGGRSPLKPSTISAHTDWREYDYTWALADWQTETTYTQPDLMLNTGGTAGYWEVQAYTLTDATDAMRAYTLADNASTAAANAQITANNAKTLVLAVVDDNLLSRDEKPSVIQQHAQITSEYAGILAQAVAFLITTEKVAYTTKYNALVTYLTALTGWNTLGTDTAIVRTDFQAAFNSYFDARQTLENKVANEAARWSNSYGTGRPADYASSDISLTAVNMSVVGNSTSKNGGASGVWDASVYSKNSFTGGAYTSFVAADITSHIVVGLSANPTSNNSYDTIDFAFYLNSGALWVFESSTGTSLAMTYSVGDVMSVQYDGVSVVYQKNGAVVSSHKVKLHNMTLYADSSFYETGSAVTGLRFGPMSNVYVAPRAGTGNTDNIVPDTQFRDLTWWGRFGHTVQDFSGGGTFWKYGYSLLINTATGGFIDSYTEWFPTTPGATYLVEYQVYLSGDFAGQMSPFWHIPGVTWHTMGGPSRGYSWTDGLAVAFDQNSPKGAQTFSAVVTIPNDFNTLRGQIRIKSQCTAGYIEIGSISITRIADMALIKDGAATDTAIAIGPDAVLSNQPSPPSTVADFTTLASYVFTPTTTGKVLVHFETKIVRTSSGSSASVTFVSESYCSVDTGAYSVSDKVLPVYSSSGSTDTVTFVGSRYLSVVMGVEVRVYFRANKNTSSDLTTTAKGIRMIIEVIKK